LRLRRALPGGGFVLLVASWGALAALIAWGMAEPDLDRAWRVLEEADRGATEPSSGDAAALARSIARHPEIALARLGGKTAKHLARTTGGWIRATRSYFLARRGEQGELRLDVESRCARRYPLTVTLEVDGQRCRLAFDGDGTRSCVLTAGAARAGQPLLGRLSADGAFGCAGDRGDGPAGLRFAEAAGGGAR
jgi:hypothetical protein